jgi:hypothetical protein
VAAQKPRGKWGGRRPGAGRKPALQDPVSFTLEVERPEIEALEAIAAERRISIASVVREAISAYLKRRRKG